MLREILPSEFVIFVQEFFITIQLVCNRYLNKDGSTTPSTPILPH